MRIKITYKVLFILLMTAVVRESAIGQVVLPTDWPASKTMRGTYYSDRFEGRKTSSGEVYTQNKYTAAHNSYKFGTLLLVTNPKTGKQVIVRINDRCPRANILDMSKKSAKQIGIGSTHVEVQMLTEDFYPYWEAQEELLDILEGGCFLEYAKKNPAPKSGEEGSKEGEKSK